MLRRTKPAAALLSLAMFASVGACNAISGIGDFDFSSGGSGGQGIGGQGPSSSAAASPTSSSSSARASGGSGGQGCGPCDQPPDDPPGSKDCALPGECIDGECVYAPGTAGEPCDDGNPCTEGDSCNAAGACVPGEECPAAECETRTCDPVRGCTAAAPVMDGTPCGLMAPADRCCAGACTNISTDPSNCGGCGLECETGECESVAATSNCESAPANTSGRCTCAGISAQCPYDGDGNKETCRTGQAQYNNLCTPKNVTGCAPGQTFLEVNLCPNYCFY